MGSSDSQIDKPQCGRPKRAELPDVNINTGAQSINSERASLGGTTISQASTCAGPPSSSVRAHISRSVFWSCLSRF